jgi:hypothetical protein
MLLDTSGLIAALFVSERHHQACARALLAARGPLLLSPFVLAEVDYLVRRFAGVVVEIEVLAEVGRGAYELQSFSAADVEEARSIISRYSDLDPGIADASIVVLSRRLGVREVLTLDERHFRALRGGGGKPFRILPADL